MKEEILYVDFAPDRVAMQDATAQMALLQFMQAGKAKVAVPSTAHADHLIQARVGAEADLQEGINKNSEVFNFLSSVCDKYGIGFWKPGAGIIHQVVLENYAFPGGMIDWNRLAYSKCRRFRMVAIGVGGADAVDVMAGMAWELKMPKLIGRKINRKNVWLDFRKRCYSKSCRNSYRKRRNWMYRRIFRRRCRISFRYRKRNNL
ncbi:aconitase family protein [Chryseobacterium indoltheticum]|uniref:aconitase family protein n=1 Tax=Chryseobacterium indoltheticum TaxID=254 RepID=UPI003F49423F